MKYDDASWHYGADNFPADLPEEAGATHSGMFLAFCVLSDLASDEPAEGHVSLRNRTITPGAYLMNFCDEKFIDEDLSDEGNAFAQSYFDFEHGDYLADYEGTFTELDPDDPNGLYRVPDTWASYDRLAPSLNRRLLTWRASCE